MAGVTIRHTIRVTRFTRFIRVEAEIMLMDSADLREQMLTEITAVHQLVWRKTAHQETKVPVLQSAVIRTPVTREEEPLPVQDCVKDQKEMAHQQNQDLPIQKC